MYTAIILDPDTGTHYRMLVLDPQCLMVVDVHHLVSPRVVIWACGNL